MRNSEGEDEEQDEVLCAKGKEKKKWSMPRMMPTFTYARGRGENDAKHILTEKGLSDPVTGKEKKKVETCVSVGLNTFLSRQGNE